MGILKDFKEDVSGYRFRYQLVATFSLKVWLRIHKWRMQRANRGWSDRDTWGAGDHIAQMTAEMLQHLNDHTYVDWPQWFKLNVKEDGKNAYKNLSQVVSDITTYLNFEDTSWADDLTTKRDSLEEIFDKQEDGNYLYKSPDWYDAKGKKLSEAALKSRMNKWHKENLKAYKKAQNAMSFFARHFTQFWD